MKNSFKSLLVVSLMGILTGCSLLDCSSSQIESESHSSNINSSTNDIITSESSEDKTSSSETIPEVNTETESKTDSSSPDPIIPDAGSGEGLNQFGLANNPQDGTILHAWSWNLKEITKAMPAIAKAGYSSVQTSPMQPQKDFYNNDSIRAWWKVYQPLGFQVATKNNAIGTKNDLIELCKTADKYGVKVIVDVVANHLAGGGRASFHGGVKEYEPEIYNNKLCHDGKYDNSDTSGKLVVQGNIGGFPDLKTEDSRVQNAVLDLLKEYVDCGVDGFRFDAAKHIETPEDDPSYASEFWNVTLNGVNEYATSKGLHKPYHYGEILHTVGNNRKYSWYTKRMSVTDSDASENTIKAVTSKDNSKIIEQDIYKAGVTSSKAVLWGESHDTFANDNGATKHVSQKDVNKAYAINASRNNAASLYFPRPHGGMKLGGMTTTVDWKSNLVTEINKFHNAFLESSEAIECDDPNYFVNYKHKDESYGAVLVNLGTEKHAEIDSLGYLGEGIYIDKITNKEFKVNNGILSGEFDDSGVAVLYSRGTINPPVISNTPRISIKDDGITASSKPIKVTINVKNCDSAYYTLNDGNKKSIKNAETITLGNENIEQNITLKVVAIKGNKEVVKSKTYTFMKGDPLSPKCMDLPLDIIKDKKVAAWVWDSKNSNATSRWVEGTLKDDTFTFDVKASDTNFILVTFNKGSKADWNNKIKQTVDLELGHSFYSVSKEYWK